MNVQDPINDMMFDLEKTLNAKGHHHLWPDRFSKKFDKRVHPDFWLGIAWGAYNQKHITGTQFIDVLLGMEALGAASDYVEKFKAQVASGEIK